MWLVFSVLAILTTGLNLYLFIKGENYHLAMGLALAFTTLTLTAQHSMIADWINAGDISALLDVVPIMSTVLWILVSISILLNVIPAFLELKKKKS